MQVYFLITNQCNLNCKMCIRGESGSLKMDYHLFSNVLESFTNKEDIIISGGECTLHSDFRKFVQKASNYGRKVIIASNGVNSSYLDAVANIENLHIQISLDGSEDNHESIRGKGTFKKVLETVKEIEKRNISYNIASVVNKNNREEIKELIPVLERFKKMKYWKVSYEMPFGYAKKEDMMLVEQWNQFVNNLIKITTFRLNIRKIYDFALYDYALDNNKVNFDKCIKNCGNCTEKVYVDTDFNVYPCTCLKNFKLGNLREETIESIIRNDKSKLFTDYQVDKNLPCLECKYYKICYGGCIGISYNFFGEIGKGDIRCPKIRDYYKV